MDPKAFRAELERLGYDEIIEDTYFPTPADVAMHSHDNDVRSLVLGGSFTLTRDGRTDTYRPGEIFEVPAGQVHGKESVPPEGLHYLTGLRHHKVHAATA